MRLQLLPQHTQRNTPQLGTQEGHKDLANEWLQVWREGQRGSWGNKWALGAQVHKLQVHGGSF